MFRFGRHLSAISLLTLALHSIASGTDNPQLREILNKHWEAMGGMRNWAQVESIRLNGTIEREGQTVDIVIVKKRPDQIRATVTLPIPGKDDEKLQVIRAHDGKTAWTATRMAGAPEMKKEMLADEAAEELLADAGVLPPLIKLWREGADLTLKEQSVVSGVEAHVIQAIPDGAEGAITFYLSTETCLLLQKISDHPTYGRTLTTIEGHIENNGVYFPSRLVIDSEATGKSVLNAMSIQSGVGIYEDYFRVSSDAETAGI